MSIVSNDPADPRRARLLEAALAVFARYGFRRASMSDIAAEAGVSRPALYLHFRSKEDMLRSLAALIRDRALAGAAAGWVEGAPFRKNLAQTLLGKEQDIFPLLYGSAHGAELLTASPALTAAIADELDARFRALLQARIEAAARAGQIDLSCVDGDAASLARLAAISLQALLREATDMASLEALVAQLARVIASAVGAK